jgi:hypothetical protein
MKRTNYVAPFLILAFALYGFWRLMFDWFGGWIREACVYIDGMGAAFWVCLAAAGVLVVVVGKAGK